MSKAIWKYQLEVADFQTVEIPVGFKILHVGDQGTKLCFWAEIETANKKETRTIGIVGTGHPIIDAGGKYVGSAIMSNGFVWHVFIN